MPTVDIEYCVPCGMLPRAQEVQRALLEQFGAELDAVALVTGDDGVFTVSADGDRLFDVSEDDYDVDEIVRRVRPYVGASASASESV
ncbi:MAG: SelT/SelW/SelH family protein [Halobacteriota archaeon]